MGGGSRQPGPRAQPVLPPSSGASRESLGRTRLSPVARGGSSVTLLGTGQGPLQTGLAPHGGVILSIPYLGPDDDQSPLLCARGLDQSSTQGPLGVSRAVCPSKARVKSASITASAGLRTSHREQELPAPTPPPACLGLTWAQDGEVTKGAGHTVP